MSKNQLKGKELAKKPSLEIAVTNNKAKEALLHEQKNIHCSQPGMHDSPSTKKLHKKNLFAQSNDPNINYSQYQSNSNLSKHQQSFAKTDRTVQLHERLKNMHLFYKDKIDEQKSQTSQRNATFLQVIQQMQKSHQQKVNSLKKMIQQAQGQKRDVNLVDEKMNDIKGSIDDILKQSADLKKSNELLEKRINQKQHTLRQKQEELNKLKEEILEARDELQSFERMHLKENKRNKEIVNMIEKLQQSHQHHS